MIRISCTNCKTILSIDDAFAGGVCRCQHCGTIQTVPASARGNATVAASGQSIGASKSLYKNGDVQSGLDELASVVVSSGLASSRLTRQGREPEASPNRPNLMLPLLLGSGVLVIILIFVIVYLLSRGNTPAPQAVGSGSAAQTSGQTSGQASGQGSAVAGPNFCGVPLTGNTVVYLIDCGSATKDYIGDLKDGVIKSAGTLTADRRFAILFWKNGDEKITAYPDDTTTYATPDSINSARSAIDDVVAFGQTDVEPAMKQAMDLHPDEIVIATGKGFELDNPWLDRVMAIRGNSHVKIDTINLGSNGESSPLKRLAEETGGTYRELSGAQLRASDQ